MCATPRTIDVYLEIGEKRSFAGALEWPGWCRSGRSEEAALEALFGAGPRYARVITGSRLGFRSPRDVEGLRVRERLAGDATTDFGAPSIAPEADARGMDLRELRRQLVILRACWRAFDRARELAEGVELAKGPRDGGRSLDAIVGHVVGAEAGYVRRLAWKPPATDDADPGASLDPVRDAVVEALDHGVRDGVPAAGPRGGATWTPRYLIRRDTWHVLDHAWEIEDRVPAT